MAVASVLPFIKWSIMSLLVLPFVNVQEWEEKRRQNIEKMNEEMEKIAEYERGQRVRESIFESVLV